MNTTEKVINEFESQVKSFSPACSSDEQFKECCEAVLELLKEQQWHDASKRPPREGRYLVWGLHEFTPDHCDEPNAYWQTRIAQWSDIYGWDVKVKFWMELPDVPNP